MVCLNFARFAEGAKEPAISENLVCADRMLCRQKQQHLQQQQKALTEMLGDQGDLGQSLLNAVG